MKRTDWKGYAALGLMALGLLLAGARWAGQIETRVDHLEQKDQFLHGSYTVPGGR